MEAGEFRVHLTDAVILEVGFVLQRTYRWPKDQVRERLQDLLSLENVLHPDRDAVNYALDLYAGLNISLGDALHASAARRLGLATIATFDRDFARIPGLAPVTPA